MKFTPTTILWRRLDQPGHDMCALEPRGDGWRIAGMAVFGSEEGSAALSYTIDYDDGWRALRGSVDGRVGSRPVEHRITRRSTGWFLNDDLAPGLERMADLDFNFTPATNFAQMRRVDMPLNVVVPIATAWLHVERGTLTVLPQTYCRRSSALLAYEAPTEDFRTELQVRTDGFVRKYPPLWEEESL